LPTDPRRFPSRRPRVPLLALAGLALFASLGCLAPLPGQGGVGGGAGDGSGDMADGPGDRARAASSVTEPVRDLPKSRRGNMVEYTVRGRRYRTLESAEGFGERGVASWYGAKFHGRETSSGEPFDMHAMTAAHRHLPLPTFVHVTNLANGRAVIVKVNDRGPFVDDRIIDLSYAAALRLDMLDSGTAEVTLEALSTHVVATTGEDATERPKVTETGSATAAATRPAEDSRPATASSARRVLQLGAFSDDARAASLARQVEPHLVARPRIVHDPERALWRVRVGPFADAAAMEAALAGLAAAGIDDYTLVAATPR